LYIDNYKIIYCVEDKCNHYNSQYGKCDVAIHKVNKNMQCVLPNEIQILRNRIEIYNRELAKIGYENDKLNEDLCDTCKYNCPCSNSCDYDNPNQKIVNFNTVECEQYERKREITYYKLNNINY